MTTITDLLASVETSIEKAQRFVDAVSPEDEVEDLRAAIDSISGHLDDAESELNEARSML